MWRKWTMFNYFVEQEGIALDEVALTRSKNPHEGESRSLRNVVEQEGIEPSSKRGNHMLSTRLVPLWFSCFGMAGTTGPEPYPLRVFVVRSRPLTLISDFLHHLVRELRSGSFGVMSRPSTLCRD